MGKPEKQPEPIKGEHIPIKLAAIDYIRFNSVACRNYLIAIAGVLVAPVLIVFYPPAGMAAALIVCGWLGWQFFKNKKYIDYLEAKYMK